MRNTWDWVVAFIIPGPVWRWWMRWVYDPVRYHVSPWAGSACDTCPWCQEIAAERGEEAL